MLEKLILFADAQWLMHPIYALFLAIDGFVYSLVAYSYRLFMLMTQLNYNAIYEMIYPLIDRVKALIIVFVLFKVAVFLIQCLINPDQLDDKSAKGGKALVVNILVCAGVMGLSPFVFDLMNDLSMAMLGNTTGAEYKILPGGASDGGFISRLVFGNASNDTDLKSYGTYLAASTLNIFLHSKENSNYFVADAIYNEIIAGARDEKSDFDFSKITLLTDDIGRTVEYKFPILSTVVGLFIIYSLVKISIEVGIRMFKLIVLQIIAPIPIASIISGGIGDGTFKKFYNLYLSTFVQIFVRVASLYLITAFIGEFFTAITSGGTGLISVDASGFTKFLILIIVIVSGYSFVNVLPNFIGGLFNLDMGEGGKGGFGKFMAGLAGAGIGAIGGFAVSRASGLGVMSSLGNALNAGYNGTKGGKIADNIKNAAGRAAAGYAAGGMFRSTLNNWDQSLGLSDARATAVQREIDKLSEGAGGTKEQQNAIDKLNKENEGFRKLQEAARNSVRDNSNGVNFGTHSGINFGSYKGVSSAEDLFSKVRSSDKTLNQLQFQASKAKNKSDYAMYQRQIGQREELLRAASQEAYVSALNNTNVISNSGTNIADIDAKIASNERDIESKQSALDAVQKQVDRLEKQKNEKRYVRN